MLDKAVREMGQLSPVEKVDLDERIDQIAGRLVKEHLKDEFSQEVYGEFVDTNRSAVLVELDGATLGTAATSRSTCPALAAPTPPPGTTPG